MTLYNFIKEKFDTLFDICISNCNILCDWLPILHLFMSRFVHIQ